VSSITESAVKTFNYQVYIRATPEAIFDALTNPQQAERYGYRSRVEYELVPGGDYRAYATDEMRAMGSPDVVLEGTVMGVDLPQRLIQTWHALFGPETAAEADTTLVFETEPREGGFTKLTLTHGLDGAPITSGFVSGAAPDTGGGWPFVLSDLKTLLETGNSLAG
jgi:uncharacterized protein YndB with AHSA1/START domain